MTELYIIIGLAMLGAAMAGVACGLILVMLVRKFCEWLERVCG